jgi:ubiquinone/menaquinone biosynthesis C-methylase UbiE
MAKDLFSTQADSYARYRPTYPKELFDYITGFVNEKDSAWDCATGNGQAANVLADYFSQVEATDISEAQLANAVQKENIHYQLSAAEQTPFSNNSFDLITIATAYHWLKWDEFHTEATRVGKKDCVVAAWAYNLLSCTDEAVTHIIHWFYKDIIGTYWDKERTFLEESYQTVMFDFAPLPTKDFQLVLHWKKEALLGFFSSWSAVQNYRKKNGTTPMGLVEEELKKVWPSDDEKEFRFPLFLRIGRVIK